MFLDLVGFCLDCHGVLGEFAAKIEGFWGLEFW